MAKNTVKIWVDDIRPSPSTEWVHTFSVEGTINLLKRLQELNIAVEEMSLDHDAGDYAAQGGDYIKILDWMEENSYVCPIHIHTANVVGRQNMIRICEHNNWPIIN